MSRLSISFCGLNFENPFVLAACPCTDELEMVRNAFRAGWAGAVLKTTHVDEFVFEPVSPILWSYDVDNSKMVGLANIDVISKYPIGVIEERVKILKKEFPGKIVIGSVTGSNRETWQEPIKRLIAAGADAIECSCSCPQGQVGLEPGKSLLTDLKATAQMLSWVKEAAGPVPVIVKLSGHVDQLAASRTIQASGGNAVNVSGQPKGIVGVDLDSWVPYPIVAGKSAFAGYSGPATKPICLWNVAEIAKKVDINVIAGGGTVSWRDALEAILLGAGQVQIASAAMRHGFRIVDDLKYGIEIYLEEKKIDNISELMGKALPNILTQHELSRDYQVVSTINRETCIKDDQCYISCRDGGHMAIELGDDRIPIVNEEKCVGCGLCRIVCPVTNCIQLKLRKNGAEK